MSLCLYCHIKQYKKFPKSWYEGHKVAYLLYSMCYSCTHATVRKV